MRFWAKNSFLKIHIALLKLVECKKNFFSICCWFWKQPIEKFIINQYSILIVSFSRALNLKFTYNIWFVFAYRLNAKSATNEEKIFFSFDQFAPCNITSCTFDEYLKFFFLFVADFQFSRYAKYLLFIQYLNLKSMLTIHMHWFKIQILSAF